ncbi:transposase [Paeniglutamicibacter sp. NPDC091659]|uniref:transposase n=1 Tax=Paeniglutamicibacter sp. NPDC091659 TaxID=3364389 RepID=UPI0037F80108
MRKLATAQKELSRRQKGSANREKARLKVARLHRTVRETRLDHHHKLARKVVDETKSLAWRPWASKDWAAPAWPNPYTTPAGACSSG